MIRPNGEVIRTPAPRYELNERNPHSGRNLNKGLRLNQQGVLLKTKDELGNEILGTHNTGEILKNDELER